MTMSTQKRETDKRCLNAAQLRRLRNIIAGQAASFSGEISRRYAELQALSRYLAQSEELRRAYRELDAECRNVGRIQRALVPESEPDVAGCEVASFYETARRAGGDYFDFFPLEDGSWGVLVADVSGHGADAAVVMAMLRTLFHTLPAPLPEPPTVLCEVNRYMCELAIGGSFATAVLGVLSADAEKFCYASAGHEPPLLVRASTGDVEALEVRGGFPLGVMPDGEFSQAETQLSSGDTLLLYTDGITEAFDPEGETFGRERLRRVLSTSAPGGAEAVRDALLAVLCDFTHGRPPHDDQTLVVVRRK